MNESQFDLLLRSLIEKRISLIKAARRRAVDDSYATAAKLEQQAVGVQTSFKTLCSIVNDVWGLNPEDRRWHEISNDPPP